MKKYIILFLILVITLMFIACSNSSNVTKIDNDIKNSSEETISEPLKVVEDFFSAFEKAEYESMKNFCSKECISYYFHEGDVFGMVWAKAYELKEEKENIKKNEARVFVDVEMETAETSALYGETETSFYVVLKKQSDDSWLIDEFVTG
ncbi:hypothetical protein I5677_08470 [Mobilitalea sibirica]|uniref:Uncharacterized protein n=1 Tax=Mobilitalea sibirica TaxID=1462919 RepID=A0A8J7H2E7_9FIRM|nr:hypothetical protein [Mobilitalea sibirica]MBH1940922.1 hypothetical protein [Mobilitalea sibirica]